MHGGALRCHQQLHFVEMHHVGVLSCVVCGKMPPGPRVVMLVTRCEVSEMHIFGPAESLRGNKHIDFKFQDSKVVKMLKRERNEKGEKEEENRKKNKEKINSIGFNYYRIGENA